MITTAETRSEAIIVDLGTATKYIYCKNQTFYGVSIAPGVSVSMKALVNNAALLPSVELVCPKKVIGTSTINCIQSGVIYGAASQVDGMIDRIKEEIGNKDVKVNGKRVSGDVDLEQNDNVEVYIKEKAIERIMIWKNIFTQI